MRRYSPWCGLAVLVVAFVAVVPASRPAVAVGTEFNGPVLSAAIRCSAGKFDVIKDSAHAPKGVSRVVTSKTSIDVYYSSSWSSVGSMQVTADETYAVNGYTFGASVGESFTRILVAHRGVQVSPASACLAWSNIWLTGWAG